MANKIVQLTDKGGDDIFPIAGGMASDSITTAMIQDGAVTSDKIDFTTYSTTPTKVGTWTDDKPIYRSVITGSIGNGAQLITDVDVLVGVKGSGFLANRYRVAGFEQIFNSQRYSFSINKNTSNIVAAEIYNAGSAATATSCNLVIEYTKTTD